MKQPVETQSGFSLLLLPFLGLSNTLLRGLCRGECGTDMMLSVKEFTVWLGEASHLQCSMTQKVEKIITGLQ